MSNIKSNNKGKSKVMEQVEAAAKTTEQINTKKTIDYKFYEKDINWPKWVVDKVSPERGYFISHIAENSKDPFTDKSVPTLFWDTDVYAQIQYILNKVAPNECGGLFFVKKISQQYPHYLIFDHILLGQEVSGGEVELEGTEVDKYIEYLNEKYQKEINKHTFGEHTNILDMIGHWHSHNNMGVFWSGTDKKQQEDKNQLAFSASKIPFFVFNVRGEYKAAFVQYKPFFHRIEDVNVGFYAPTIASDQSLILMKERLLGTVKDSLANIVIDPIIAKHLEEQVEVLTNTIKTEVINKVLKDLTDSNNLTKEVKDLLDEQIKELVSRMVVHFPSYYNYNNYNNYGNYNNYNNYNNYGNYNDSFMVSKHKPNSFGYSFEEVYDYGQYTSKDYKYKADKKSDLITSEKDMPTKKYPVSCKIHRALELINVATEDLYQQDAATYSDILDKRLPGIQEYSAMISSYTSNGHEYTVDEFVKEVVEANMLYIYDSEGVHTDICETLGTVLKPKTALLTNLEKELEELTDIVLSNTELDDFIAYTEDVFENILVNFTMLCIARSKEAVNFIESFRDKTAYKHINIEVSDELQEVVDLFEELIVSIAYYCREYIIDLVSAMLIKYHDITDKVDDKYHSSISTSSKNAASILVMEWKQLDKKIADNPQLKSEVLFDTRGVLPSIAKMFTDVNSRV